MPKVNLLSRELYELIAAGEVIERPSSVIKELIENSIDSGASSIAVEIRRGGTEFMRVTDNGCGIAPEDVHTAFLRHATSKICSVEDLTSIRTLGFRGEALASVAAVSKVDVLTKPPRNDYGTHYVIEGTEEKLNEPCGCPNGTTITIRDIFYNVPARLKFLKKDVAEGNDIAKIIEKIALSHPEISFRFIRDNKQCLFTPGDSKLFSSVYSVLGKEFASSLLPVDYVSGNIRVSGYTAKPIMGAKNRKLQNYFVNGRYVQSTTCIMAVEEAYKNCIMEGKFPTCVICLDVPPETIDVNVHPQKIEVRFTEERTIYETLYFAVKNALMSDTAPEEIKLSKPVIDYTPPDKNKYEQTAINTDTKKTDTAPVNRISAEEYRRVAGISPIKSAPEVISSKDYKAKAAEIEKAESRANKHEVELPWEKKLRKPEPEKVRAVAVASESTENSAKPNTFNVPSVPETGRNTEHHPDDNIYDPENRNTEKPTKEQISSEGVPIEQLRAENTAPKEFRYINSGSFEKKEEEAPPPPEEKPIPIYSLIGEAFRTYIIAEIDDEIIFIDKHAAHERINFERMRNGEVVLDCQLMLEEKKLRLTHSQFDAVCEHTDTIRELGFDIVPDTPPCVVIKGIPSVLDGCDAESITAELAENLENNRHNPMPDILDDMLHTIACKASVRANDDNSPEELKVIVNTILRDERIRYCPHGRPVMFKLRKTELEKQFRRRV